MPNTNCLEGLACPKCGSEGPFYIMAMALFMVYDSGTEDYQDVDWDDESYCRCHGCGFAGTVLNFDKEERELQQDDIPGGADGGTGAGDASARDLADEPEG